MRCLSPSRLVDYRQLDTQPPRHVAGAANGLGNVL